MSASRRPSPIRRTQADRIHGLLEAHRTINSDLSLTAMLERIVIAACDLVGARYGALGVVGVHGSVEQFVDHGMNARSVAVIRQPMRERACLGVPIRVRDEVFGELYLADPMAGRFGADDEEMVAALAATAGTAIEKARLYDEARRSKEWLNASGEIARALLANADVDVLLEIVSRALDVAEADYGGLVLPTDDGRLKVMVTVGVGAGHFRGHIFEPAASPMGRAIVAGQSRLTSDMTQWAKPDFVNTFNFGPAMIAPLVDSQGARGAVLLMRTADRPSFSHSEVELATTFATQVALALQYDDDRADAEWLHVLEDRQAIAEDLHDNVMQRLFATGVGLQGLANQDLDPNVAQRLRGHIADLDETIDEIRTRVFGLQNDVETPPRRTHARFPRVARTAASAARGVGTVARRSFTPRRRRREKTGVEAEGTRA
jgi:signal transduction histidine kinase